MARRRLAGRGALAGLAAAVLFAIPALSHAQDAETKASDTAAAEAPANTAGQTKGGVGIELNKLEPQGDSCRAYVVIRNKSERHYESFKLDLIEFRTDGIIGHRFAIDLGPIRPEKTLVKLFEIADTACEEIGSFLINDVMECSTESGALDDCFSGLSVSTRADADLTK